MPLMEIIRFAELTESKWKNGGGITREILSASLSGSRIWRLSMADVACDGPFSEFAEYDRILTIVKGQGLRLQSDGGCIDADPWSPVRFSGDLKIDAYLKSGPLTDLNLMFNPDYCTGDVTVINGPCHQSLAPDERRVFVVHSVAGSVKINDLSQLLPGDTAIIGPDMGQIEMQDDDAALLIKIDLNTRFNPDALVFTAR